ncbi:unnamed protein product [Effrenium voratum]|uniref:Uncharacterized protein n=1 Tax=Effrenium voratum TaxID=2562239 RepID=A0AA36IZ74_9DINO|nr:unnamed protein product [Effrenium voratum]CAJ1396692.1 unnamed protein product [Effrenium voratum]CAJ1412417.1 unnamed protein product [Effrenium voratum]
MAQAKSRTDAERMEALERLLQEESVEDWRSLQLGAPRAAMPASDSVSSRDPRNLRDPSNGTTACDFRGADFGCLFCRMWVSQSDGWTLRSLARLGPTDLQAASEKEEEHPNPCVGVAKEASQSCVCSGNLARGYSSTLTQQQLAMVARWSSASD